MSEYGNETATAALRLGEKAMDALLKLLKFIVNRNERKFNRAIRKQQLVKLKSEKNSQELSEYLDKTRGLVNAKKLLNCGEPLLPLKVPMSPNELKRFNKLAKIYGVTFTAIANETVSEELKKIKRELKEISKLSDESLCEEQMLRREELEQRKAVLENSRLDKIIVIRQNDLELVKDITDRLNMEIQLADLDHELQDLQNKDAMSLTDEDKKRIEYLKQHKEEILRGEFDDFNYEKNDSIYQNSMGIPTAESLTFDEAINRVTDRKYSQQPCFICERTNPDNYIEITSKIQKYEDRTFTNTEFQVYHQGEKQICDEFKHGKFTHFSQNDGENSTSYGENHWTNMKTEMKKKGEFTDDTIIFTCEKHYLLYKETFNKSLKKEIENKKNYTRKEENGKEKQFENKVGDEQYKDYMSKISELEDELKGMSLVVNPDNQICRVGTGEIVDSEAELDSKLSFAKALNIKEQISAYKELNTTQTRLAFALQQQKSIENEYKHLGRPEVSEKVYESMRNEAHAEIYECNMKVSALGEKLHSLSLERDKLLSIEIVENMQKKERGREKPREKSQKDLYRHTKTKKDWEKTASNNNHVVKKRETEPNQKEKTEKVLD